MILLLHWEYKLGLPQKCITVYKILERSVPQSPLIKLYNPNMYKVPSDGNEIQLVNKPWPQNAVQLCKFSITGYSACLSTETLNISHTQLHQQQRKLSWNIAQWILTLSRCWWGCPYWNCMNVHHSALCDHTSSLRLLLLPYSTLYFILIKINNWKLEINVCKLRVVTIDCIGLTLFLSFFCCFMCCCVGMSVMQHNHGFIYTPVTVYQCVL